MASICDEMFLHAYVLDSFIDQLDSPAFPTPLQVNRSNQIAVNLLHFVMSLMDLKIGTV